MSSLIRACGVLCALHSSQISHSGASDGKWVSLCLSHCSGVIILTFFTLFFLRARGGCCSGLPRSASSSGLLSSGASGDEPPPASGLLESSDGRELELVVSYRGPEPVVCTGLVCELVLTSVLEPSVALTVVVSVATQICCLINVSGNFTSSLSNVLSGLPSV